MIGLAELAEIAFITEIGKMNNNTKVISQVIFKSGDTAEMFTHLHTWTLSSKILRLGAGPMSLASVTFHVADKYLAAEQLLIRLPIFRHLGVD